MIRRPVSIILTVALGVSLSACGHPNPTTDKLAGALAAVRDGGIPAPLSMSAALAATDGNPFPGKKLDVRPASCLGVVPGTLSGLVGESEPLAGAQLNGVTMVAGRPASTADASVQLGRLRASAATCRALTLTPVGEGSAPATLDVSDAGADGVLATVTVQAPGRPQTLRFVEGVVGTTVVVVSSTTADDATVRRVWAETAKAVADANIG